MGGWPELTGSEEKPPNISVNQHSWSLLAEELRSFSLERLTDVQLPTSQNPVCMEPLLDKRHRPLV